MNSATSTPPRIGSGRMITAMTATGALCALFIVLAYQGTLPRIEYLKAKALEKAIVEVIPGMTSQKVFRLQPDGTLQEVQEAAKDASLVYAGYDLKGNLAGVAIEASGMGFADVIRIIYGYNPATEQIIGFRVLESKETPGLGDKIEKDPAFLENFKTLPIVLSADKSRVQHRIVAVKHGKKEKAWELDGITGATISSRAVGNILGTSTEHIVPVLHKNLPLLENLAKQ